MLGVVIIGNLELTNLKNVLLVNQGAGIDNKMQNQNESLSVWWSDLKKQFYGGEGATKKIKRNK